MSSRIKKPHELEVKVIVKSLIYGQPGIGKSTLGLSAPKPLYIDTDGGNSRVDRKHLTDTIPVGCWEDIDSIFIDDLTPYETLVIDTAGKMLRYMNEFIGRMNPRNKQADGTLTQKGYGVRREMFVDFLLRAEKLGKDIVFIAHDKENKKGELTIVRPDIGGGSTDDLIRELDLVGYYEAVSGARTISFIPTETHYGKNTIGLPPMIEVPDVFTTSNNLLTKIFDQYRERAVERKKMNDNYVALIQYIQEHVDAISNAEDANKVYETISTSNEIWDSKIVCKRLVVNKAKELGLIANSETKKFEDAPVPAVEEKASEPAKNEAQGEKSEEKSEPEIKASKNNAKKGQDPEKKEDLV